MHWRGYWWGIELVAENEDDESLLKQLIKKLPRKALMSYDGDATYTTSKKAKC